MYCWGRGWIPDRGGGGRQGEFVMTLCCGMYMVSLSKPLEEPAVMKRKTFQKNGKWSDFAAPRKN